jgi:RNA-directed DNA polymerase
VIRFSSNFEDNIQHLRGQLLSESVAVGNYSFFKVFDPKERLICAAAFPERVLHHAMMNHCEPVLDNFSIFDSYACRKGKGLHKALARAAEFTRKKRWYLKLDIRKYFDSIDHDIAMTLLARRFKDPRLLRLFEKILCSYSTRPGKGVPIGNLISQHLANFYLGVFDHWIKEARHIRHYIRYMDDFVLFGGSKGDLRMELAAIREFLAVHLSLSLREPVQLNRCAAGLPFLGFRVFGNRVRLSPRSRKRFVRRFRDYERKFLSGEWSEPTLVRHIQPLIAFTRAADAAGFRRRIVNRYGVPL